MICGSGWWTFAALWKTESPQLQLFCYCMAAFRKLRKVTVQRGVIFRTHAPVGGGQPHASPP